MRLNNGARQRKMRTANIEFGSVIVSRSVVHSSKALAITLGSQFLHLGLCWIVLAGPSHGIPCVPVGSSGFSYVLASVVTVIRNHNLNGSNYVYTTWRTR